MATYIGKRIVPVHCGIWEKNKDYEMLSIVLEETSGDSYIARRAVPAGTDISDQHYWMLHSLFSQQIKDMSDQLAAAEQRIRADNDATEQAIRENNAETENAIREDNAATIQRVENSLSETEQSLTDTVNAARTAMTQQKQSFDSTAVALNTRMDSVLAAGTGDGAAEVLDARVDDSGKTHASLGEHIRSIRATAQGDTANYFSDTMNRYYNPGILRESSKSLHGGSLSYPYSTSTFSGWVSQYKITERTIAMGIDFYLKARTTPITKVTVMIALDERKKSNVIFRKELDVEVPESTAMLLSCELPGLIFEAGQTVFICIAANVICTSGFGSKFESSTVSWYATEGLLPSLQSFSEGTEYRLYIVLHGYAEGKFITKELEETTENHEERIQTVEEWRPLINCFDMEEVYEDIQRPLPISNVIDQYNSSTFIGWATPVGKLRRFDTMIFMVKNRNTTDYIEKVRCVIAKESHKGNVLIDETHDGLHIAPGEWRKIEFQFSRVIENEEEEQLYAGFSCDGLVTIKGGTCGVNLNPPNYAVVAYNHAPDSYANEMKRALRYWTEIHDPSAENTTKMDVRFALRVKKYSLGEFQDEVHEIAAEEAEAAKEEKEPRIVLPKTFHAVVGDTLQLFYRGIVEHPDPYFYNIEFICDIGKNTPRYFEVTPSAEQAGSHTLTVNVRDNRDRVLATAQCKILVHAVKNSPTEQKNILCIGDSLTSSGTWCREAMRRLTATDGTPAGLGLSNIRFIGTKKNGDCGYEGYGGWTWSSYLSSPSQTTLDMWVYCTHDKDSSDQHSLWKDEADNIWSMETISARRIKFTRYQNHTAAMPIGTGTLTHYQNAAHTEDIHYDETVYAEGNPFWDSDERQVNFQTYCERNGFGGIDYVYTLLTWNGLGGYYAEADSSAIANHVNNAKRLLRILHSQYPDAKVKVMGIQLPSLNGGTGRNYGANSVYSNWYGLVRSVMGMNLAYQAMANEDEFKSYVEFINVSAQFDSEYNMPWQAKAVNTRSTITEPIGTNGVHPGTEGYNQIGDAAFRSMVGELTQ